MTYQELLDFARECAGEDFLLAFKEDGLLLEPTPIKWDYEATPQDALTFATTGGDGVHFSFLGESVVMTVPMNFGEENLVLAKNLDEFLSLGLDFGFFGLEQLSYDLEGTAALVEAAEPGSRSSFLGELALRYKLEPWSGVLTRLLNLQT